MDQSSLYTYSTYRCSKVITQLYSTSFSWGIRSFDARYRFPIYAIYAFVRYADEIVDTFQGCDKRSVIAAFRSETTQAIATGLSMNPVLQAFQDTVNRYRIDQRFIDAFFSSMECDLEQKRFDRQAYEAYIYGSAEVIGLMCLRVFCPDDGDFDRLSVPARRLGAAFQKVNFLRDFRSDFLDRDRVYFPGMSFETFGDAEKKAVEKEIAADFAAGLEGICKLPAGFRRGVYVAYVYYLALFKKLKRAPAVKVKAGRIRVPDTQKLVLLCKAVVNDRFKRYA
ncbi:phytoene synthase [Pedobacter yulinensis]|uniref:Phytoene synthase n=1 Tax=Pedobacter yulinensis TaxID=2126353 RepID=A0A2T3HPL3_9SPHI|nr:phytoene/squalene synthase family protein [Pedobacter yulinensis]PST84388.1 phytoene synthase [Pedobacter yulinensis]